MKDIIPYIVTVLGGGLVGKWLTHKSESKKQDNSDFKLVIDDRKNFSKELLERIGSMEKTIEELRDTNKQQAKEINGLRMQILMLEGSHTDIPLPIWLKDKSGRILFVNDYYSDLFLTPRGYKISDYVGNTDYDVWSKEAADSFRKNDEMVTINKVSSRYIEEIDSIGGKLYIEVLKYPRLYKDEIIGIGGIVLNTAITKEELCE